MKNKLLKYTMIMIGWAIFDYLVCVWFSREWDFHYWWPWTSCIFWTSIVWQAAYVVEKLQNE